MSLTKINKFIERYDMDNIINIVIILIILLILYRLFKITCENNSNFNNNNTNKIIENFYTTSSYNNYGNILTLKNSNNIPLYSNNKCILKFLKNQRIDTIVLKFNPKNNKNKNGINKFTSNIDNIYIQYLDDNNNLRNLKNTTEGINFISDISGVGDINNPYELNLKNIRDENNLMVYTSKIVIIIDNEDNNLLSYMDNQNIGYIKEYCIFGGSRKLLSKEDYDTMSGNFENITLRNRIVNNISNNNKFNFIGDDNLKIYSLNLNFVKNQINKINQPATIIIKYNNTIYPSETFTISKKYYVRTDKYNIFENLSKLFIFLDEPIIANKVIFEIEQDSVNNISINSLSINGIKPNYEDITDFKKYVNILLNRNNLNDINLCPTIDKLVEKQTKTQQICDNLEYQDKVKSEKIRLERNKQYLLKLKNQQEQIDELNNVIQDIENKKEMRDTSADKIRILQYQKQKGDASTIRDLANERLKSQDNNKLFMDVNLNYTD